MLFLEAVMNEQVFLSRDAAQSALFDLQEKGVADCGIDERDGKWIVWSDETA